MLKKFGWMMVCLLLAACAGSFGRPWHKPEVSLVGVHMAGGNLFEQRLKLKLRVVNSNAVDIPLEALRFELLAEDKRYALGHTDAPVVIPHDSDVVVEVEASAQLLKLIQALPKLTAADHLLHYRLKGSAVITGYGDVPFDHPGTLDMAVLDGLAGRRASPSEP